MNTNFFIGLTLLGIKSESPASETDVLSIWSSEYNVLESPTDVVDEMGNSTALNTTVEEGTNGAGGVEVEPLDPDEEPTSPEEPTVSASPEDGNVTIIHCIMNTVYPVPNKVTFRTTGANSGMNIEKFQMMQFLNLFMLVFF